MKKFNIWGMSFLAAITVTACGGAGQETTPTSNEMEAASEVSEQTDASLDEVNKESALESALENVPEELDDGEMLMVDYDFSQMGISGSLPDTEVSLDSLREKNSDVCAYIAIPGTGISDVVLKKDDSNDYYLEHSADGENSKTGAIFMDMGNGTDFSDPVTCLYAKAGEDAPFSELVNYLDAGFANDNEYIYIYSDDYVSEYKVFAAYDTDDTERLLVKYNFYDYNEYQSYISEVFSMRDMTAVLKPELISNTVSTWNIITLVAIDDDGSRQLVQAVFNGRTTY